MAKIIYEIECAYCGAKERQEDEMQDRDLALGSAIPIPIFHNWNFFVYKGGFSGFICSKHWIKVEDP